MAGADPACALILCRVPIAVPDSKRMNAVDAVNRANFGRFVGAFEMDPSDGRLYCKASILINGCTLTVDQFVLALGTVVGLAARYFRAFARLVYGDDLSPAEVIAEVEMAETEAEGAGRDSPYAGRRRLAPMARFQ